MTTLTPDLVAQALRTVNDPELHKDLVTLDMVKGIQVDGSTVTVGIELTTPACPMKDRIRNDVTAAIASKAASIGATTPQVVVEFTADVRRPNQKAREGGNPLPMVKHVIAVGAGKGGVGKSTISVNLAVALARMGAKVGLLDGDIYGPSLPTLLGLDELGAVAKGNILMPFEVHGIKAMTIGKLVDPEKALVWRGPMAHGAFKQLATQTDWGALDYLIIDLPPGTGDVPLTLAQLLPVTGAVVVCTPQRVAQDDARRAVRMFEGLGIDVLGVVENMSYFVGDDGKEYDLFGRGGAEMMAQQMGLPFLGSMPIHMALRKNSDAGTPLANWDVPAMGRQLDAMAQALAGQVSIASMRGQFVQPTISVR
jgi:ATP-binding protein involved in chromosome partitioning